MFLYLAFGFAILSSAFASSTIKQLDQISVFLEQESTSDDPRVNLGLIKSNEHEFRGPVAKSLIEMAEGPGCGEPKIVEKIKARYSDASTSVKMQQLLQHVAKLDLDRCRSTYIDQLVGSLHDLKPKWRDQFMELLSDDFISKLHEKNSSLVESISPPDQPGTLLSLSAPHIVDYIKVKIPGGHFNPRLKTDVLKGAKLVAKVLAKVCPRLLEKSSPSIGQMRDLVAISGNQRMMKLSGLGWKQLRHDVFRYRFCEEFIRISKSPKYMRKIRDALKSHKLNDQLHARSKRELIGMLVLGIGGVALVVMVIWLIVVQLSDPRPPATHTIFD